MESCSVARRSWQPSQPTSRGEEMEIDAVYVDKVRGQSCSFSLTFRSLFLLLSLSFHIYFQFVPCVLIPSCVFAPKLYSFYASVQRTESTHFFSVSPVFFVIEFRFVGKFLNFDISLGFCHFTCFCAVLGCEPKFRMLIP